MQNMLILRVWVMGKAKYVNFAIGNSGNDIYYRKPLILFIFTF